jgi:HD-like signal output (HDOD) protein
MSLWRLLENKINEIPTLPVVANKIIEILDNPRSSANDLEKIISMDQSLASKVLRLVNSAYYGFPRRITTVGQGVVILGFDAIKHLTLSVSVADIFRLKGNSRIFDRSSLWKHSVGTGVCAKLLARKASLPLLEEAFIAGLLHDIGIVIIDYYFPEKFEEILEMMEKEHIPLVKAELRVLGFTHALVGKLVTQKWNFPALLAETIGYHNKPFQNDNYCATITLVFAADALCRQTGEGEDGDITDRHLEMEAWSWLGLPWSERQAVLQELDGEIKKAAEFVNLVSLEDELG